MSYFRKTPKLESLFALLQRNQKWLITINADPDAMASAMALRRMFLGKVAKVSIAKVNTITRPDNLVMVRYMHLHMFDFHPELLKEYTHFALVDAQPSHHPVFENINYTVIVDHHPLSLPPEVENNPNKYIEIKGSVGTCSTIFTEYLYNLKIRPGKLLATALQFGIRTDTLGFQRNSQEVDLRAYQYLSKFSSSRLLRNIVSSEYHKVWLKYFSKGIKALVKLKLCHFVYLGRVESPDILVAVGDFFNKVLEIKVIVVAGFCAGNAIIVFRGDGFSLDAGKFASICFEDLGSGGGHKGFARAEFELKKINGKSLKHLISKRLDAVKKSLVD